MDSKVIVQMDGKKTRLIKPKHITIDNNNANVTPSRSHDNFHDFTFDYSYWSCGESLSHNQPIVTQEIVYNDLGMDVINCAFQGMHLTMFLD